MNTKITDRTSALESKRKALFSKLTAYSDELINKKPDANSWSVAQVIEHLITAEEASLKYLQKKTLDTSKAAKAGWKSKRNLLLTKAACFMPFKFKAPPEPMKPAEVFMPLKELEVKWSGIRKSTNDILDRLSDDELGKELWKHYIAGKMNIYQMLDFFETHFDRHVQQIERTIGKSSAAK